MPPRFAYWTIIVDDKPTAFRAAVLEDIMPTFNRLKQKDATAVLKWFQNGQLWPSRLDAREAMRSRGEQGKRKDPRQGGEWGAGASAFAPRASADRSGLPKPQGEKLDWQPRDPNAPPPAPRASRPQTDRPEWRPKGASPSRPAFKARSAKTEWKPKTGAKPDWKPKREGFARGAKPEWKPKGASRPERTDWKPRGDQARPAWKPKGEGPPARRGDKPEWKPSNPKSASTTGTGDKRDKKWRPGGDHQDPRQKYKDAKKAKWTRFKQAIRARTGHKKKDDK